MALDIWLSKHCLEKLSSFRRNCGLVIQKSANLVSSSFSCELLYYLLSYTPTVHLTMLKSMSFQQCDTI